jgi:hypothetical protein
VGKASGRQCKIWYRSRLQAVGAALLVAYLMLITFLVAGLAGVFRIGLLLSVAEALLGALLLVSLSPVLLIRSDLIRIWHGYRFTNIGIGEVAGVGLLYARKAGWDGDWRLYIWRDYGGFEETGIRCLLRQSNKRKNAAYRRNRNWAAAANFDPVAAIEIPELAASRGARVAREICQRVLAAQGPEGSLQTRQLEKHQPPISIKPGTQIIAYWSPDGQYGRCR